MSITKTRGEYARNTYKPIRGRRNSGGGKGEAYKQVIYRRGDPIPKHMRKPPLAIGEKYKAKE